MNTLLTLILALVSPLAVAGGSHYGTPAGTPVRFSGQVSEWSVPTPAFARDPAVAPDGAIFIAVMAGNKVARSIPPASPSRNGTCQRGTTPTASWSTARASCGPPATATAQSGASTPPPA